MDEQNNSGIDFSTIGEPYELKQENAVTEMTEVPVLTPIALPSDAVLNAPDVAVTDVPALVEATKQPDATEDDGIVIDFASGETSKENSFNAAQETAFYKNLAEELGIEVPDKTALKKIVQTLRDSEAEAKRQAQQAQQSYVTDPILLAAQEMKNSGRTQREVNDFIALAHTDYYELDVTGQPIFSDDRVYMEYMGRKHPGRFTEEQLVDMWSQKDELAQFELADTYRYQLQANKEQIVGNNVKLAQERQGAIRKDAEGLGDAVKRHQKSLTDYDAYRKSAPAAINGIPIKGGVEGFRDRVNKMLNDGSWISECLYDANGNFMPDKFEAFVLTNSRTLNPQVRDAYVAKLIQTAANKQVSDIKKGMVKNSLDITPTAQDKLRQGNVGVPYIAPSELESWLTPTTQ